MMVSEGLWKEQFLLSGQCGERNSGKKDGELHQSCDWNRGMIF